jgi:hypothetical protein
MAIVANLAVSRHRLTGASNIAACREISRHPTPSYRYSQGQINYCRGLPCQVRVTVSRYCVCGR